MSDACTASPTGEGAAQHPSSAEDHEREVDAGERFGFGENWRRFLSVLDEKRIAEAERSLTVTLELESLEGREFLDAGSGSGLFSLAAMRLGAERVHSFDFDPNSVTCTRELKRRFFPGDDRWTIEQGSVLDDSYLDRLGTFAVVYSWGVLHHTGAMWDALENVDPLVEAGGFLYISIYNDQGFKSRQWRRLKRVYNALPSRLRLPFAVAIMGPWEVASAVKHLLLGRPLEYVRSWTEYHRSRGMSRWHDIVDWIGGYPFEVAKPEEVFDFYRHRGYELVRLKTWAGGLGCNEYLFRKQL